MILVDQDIGLIPEEIALDIETSGLQPWSDKIILISISTKDNTYVYNTNKHPKEYFVELFESIKECNCLVIGQNIKFDLSFIYFKYGVLLTRVWDTMIASQIRYNGLGYKHDLTELLIRELNIWEYNKNKKKYYQKSFIGLGDNAVCTKEQIKYASSDTRHLIELKHKQFKDISEFGLKTVMRLEMRLLPVLVKMEVRGCRIDRDGWKNIIDNIWVKQRVDLINKLDNEITDLLSKNNKDTKKYSKPRKTAKYTPLDLFGNHTEEIVEIGGGINYNSPTQIIELFGLLNEPIPKVTDGEGFKESVGEDALKLYLAEYPKTQLKPFITLLLKLREFEKLISTYGYNFLKKLDENSRIHTSYSQAFTETGRLSSKSPNLQNIPSTKLDKDGYDLRTFFLPEPSHKMITCDMDSAEVRIAGDYSNERSLLNSVIRDEDLHSKLASVSYSIIFGTPVKVSKHGTFKYKGMEFSLNDMRNTHKSVLFAKFYKGGAQRCYEVLSEYINLVHKDGQMEIANKLSKAIDKALPKLTRYLTKVIKDTNLVGWNRGTDKIGRIRFFKEDAYGEAANFPIQNTNAEALKIAMITIDEYLTKTGYGHLLMNIHDEVVISVMEEHAEEVAKRVEQIMGDSLGWFLKHIDGGATAHIGDYWQK